MTTMTTMTTTTMTKGGDLNGNANLKEDDGAPENADDVVVENDDSEAPTGGDSTAETGPLKTSLLNLMEKETATKCRCSPELQKRQQQHLLQQGLKEKQLQSSHERNNNRAEDEQWSDNG